MQEKIIKLLEGCSGKIGFYYKDLNTQNEIKYNIMTLQEFQQSIREGIPAELPAPKAYEPEINHAPKRKDILTKEEKKLAIRNALRYFDPKHHAVLAPEFAEELEKYGRF